MLNGLETITALAGRYKIVEDTLQATIYDPPPKEFTEALLRLYGSILKYEFKAVVYLNRNTLGRLVKNIPKVDDWAGMQQTISENDTECRYFAESLQSLRNTRQLRELGAALREQQATLDTLITNIKSKEGSSRDFILEISDATVEQDHEDVRNRLGEKYWGSCQWLLKHSSFVEWRQRDTRIISLQGSLGVGKTCAMAAIVQNLLSTAIDEQVAFFYCSQQQNAPADVLRALLAQIAVAEDGNLHVPIKSWMDLQAGLPFRMRRTKKTAIANDNFALRCITVKECCDLLAQVIQLHKRTTFVVDALDECSDPEELLDRLSELCRTKNCQLLVSSRFNISQFNIDVRNYVDKNIVLSDDTTAADVNDFIEQEVKAQKHRNRSGMNHQQAKQLERLLKSRAQGM